MQILRKFGLVIIIVKMELNLDSGVPITARGFETVAYTMPTKSQNPRNLSKKFGHITHTALGICTK